MCIRDRTSVVRRRKLMARQVTATVILVLMSVLVALGMMAQPHWVTPATTLFIVLLGVFGLKQPGMIVLSAALLAQVSGREASGLASRPITWASRAALSTII